LNYKFITEFIDKKRKRSRFTRIDLVFYAVTSFVISLKKLVILMIRTYDTNSWFEYANHNEIF